MIYKKIASIVSVFLFVLSFPVYAFDSIDSLKHLLLTDKADTTKAIHLNGICREYLNKGDFPKELQNGNVALVLANNLNKKKEWPILTTTLALLILINVIT